MLKAQSDEISSLRATVEELKTQITKLTITKDQESETQVTQSASENYTVSMLKTTILTLPNPATKTTKTQLASSVAESSIKFDDKKFNLIVFGINESPPNTPRLQRLKSDLDQLITVFKSINAPTGANSVKDFYCLGKYNPAQSCPRPILVKFLRTIDVTTILSNRGSLKAPFL